MSSASKVTQLQDRMAERNARIQITEIVEQQPEPEFDSVGAELRAHRNRKGHELEMAGRVLRIKIAHIEAIEESDYAALPGKAYAIGFVRSYAEYLGLDPDDCIRRFKMEYSEAMDPKPVEGEAPKKTSAGAMAFPEARDEVRLPHGSMIILGAMIVMMIWGGWYITSNSEQAFTEVTSDDAGLEAFEAATANTVPIVTPQSRPEPPQQVVPEGTATTTGAETATDTPAVGEPVVGEATAGENATTVSEPVPDETQPIAVEEAAVQAIETEVTAGDQAATNETPIETVEPEVVAALDPAPVNEGANLPENREPQVFGMQNYDSRVIVRARADTWVRIEDLSGGVLFEATMKQGDSYRVPNRDNIIMATRNAGALELLVDGSSVGPAGRIGQAVLEQSLDAGVLAANVPSQP